MPCSRAASMQTVYLPGFTSLPGVVLAVPLEGVLSGRARRAGYRGGDVVAFGHGAHAIVAVPGAQLGSQRALSNQRAQRAHRELVLVLDPDGDVRTARAHAVEAAPVPDGQ